MVLGSCWWCSDCQGKGKLFEQWHDVSCLFEKCKICLFKEDLWQSQHDHTISKEHWYSHHKSILYAQQICFAGLPTVTITLATGAALGLIIFASLVSLGLRCKRRKRKTDKKEPSGKEMNPLYGLYYFHDGEKMEDNYVSVTDENSYYGWSNPFEIVCITNKINTTQANIFNTKLSVS